MLRFCPADLNNIYIYIYNLSDPEDQLAYAKQAAFCCPPAFTLSWTCSGSATALAEPEILYHSGELARSGLCNCNDLIKRVPKLQL